MCAVISRIFKMDAGSVPPTPDLCYSPLQSAIELSRSGGIFAMQFISPLKKGSALDDPASPPKRFTAHIDDKRDADVAYLDFYREFYYVYYSPLYH